jgi:hypothetical protein
MGWDLDTVVQKINTKFLWVYFFKSVSLEVLEVDGRIRLRWNVNGIGGFFIFAVLVLRVMFHTLGQSVH